MNPLELKISNLADQVNFLKEREIYLYYRELDSAQDAEMVADGRKILMFGSNSYLGLSNHPLVKKAAIEAIEKYGTGVSGSRLLNGNLKIHRQLEERLAAFVGMEDAVVLSTGFQANLAAIPSLLDRTSWLLLDKLSHASILEGAALSPGTKVRFAHNDTYALEKKLALCDPAALKLVVTEGVFSMDGDIPDLPAIVESATKYNAKVMVDDAHATGVLGVNGRGSSSHFGMTSGVDMITSTFSKSLGALGGFVAANKEIIGIIKHTARAQMFSAGLQPASVATVLKALDILEEQPELIGQLWENTHYTMKKSAELGLDTGKSVTPIIPIYIRDDYKTYLLAKRLYDDGIFVNPVVSPATSPDSSLIRFSIMTTHKKAQIDFALERINHHLKQMALMTSAAI